MAHEGHDTGADPMFIGECDFGDYWMFFGSGESGIGDDAPMFGGIGEDAPNMFVGGGGLGDALCSISEARNCVTTGPELLPQSGTETVGGTDQQLGLKRKNREISEASQPAEKEGMSKDKKYRAKKKVAQQEMEKENNDLKAENEQLKCEIGQLKSHNTVLEMEVLKLKAEVQKQTYEGEIKVLKLEKDIKERETFADKEKAEKRYIQRVLDITNQKQTQTKELPLYKTMFDSSAVAAEELWWRAIDFARLNRSASSFSTLLKPETATSKWKRFALYASKVGKGLCKDAKARKLALQHWIEAIDARYRCGHNLHFYYNAWLNSDARQPFFFWLDLGAGKELDLKACPRSKLRQQCVKYLGPREREHYEYIVAEGQIKHKQTEELLDTISVSKQGKWIFVMSTSKQLYAAKKKRGLFHHSSFLAGGATLAAGKLEVENGILKSISAHSGYYRHNDLDNLLSLLKEKRVNINEVKACAEHPAR